MKTIIVLFTCLNTVFYSAVSINPQREAMLNEVFEILEANVANPAWLETPEFIEFKSELYSDMVMKMSDEDFLKHFKQKRKNLTFTHFDLHSTSFLKSVKSESKNKPALYWEELDEDVAYLRVRTFSTDAAPMVKALNEIGIDKYPHLIIDLRDNGGGSLDAPVVLGRFLTQQPIDAGVYLTRRWYDNQKRSATTKDIAGFPFLEEFTYAGITKMFQNEEAFRMVLPPHQEPIYQGKVYVIINSNTASACEPLIDLFQKKKIATLVGPPSAGAMLSGQSFTINKKYKVFVPISDYQTADGGRLDKVGVIPEHKVPSEQTLDYVLNELITRN